MKNLFLRLKRSASNKITNIKNKTKKGAQKFKENFHKAKIKPRSKRESLFLGFTTTLSIFGIGLLVTMLPAVAKDVPKNGVKPGEVSPTPIMENTPGAEAGKIVGRILADVIYYGCVVGTAAFSLKFLTKVIAKNTIRNIHKNNNNPYGNNNY